MQHDKELPKWYMQIIDKLHIYTRFKAITKDINEWNNILTQYIKNIMKCIQNR